MRTALPSLALLMLCAGTIPVAAAPAAVAEPATDDLAQLIDLVVPADVILAAARDGWGAELNGRFEGDEQAVALEARRPGLRDAYVQSGLDEVTATYRQTLDQLRGDAMRVYAEALTPAEIRELVTFFRTPTGAKLVAAMQRGVIASDGLDAEGMRADGRRAAMDTIDESDRPALEAFSRTAVFAKTQKVSALIAEVSGIAIAAHTRKLGMAVPAATARTMARWAAGEGGGQ